MRHAGEPSVDEILESIKRVIARDNRQGAVEERRRRETRGVALPAEEEDVLDLAESARLVDEIDEEADAEADPREASLINPAAQASMRESLAALAMLAEPGAQPRIVRSGETSVEDLMRELLRPALAEWLDRNLPPMVESMVSAEIRRIAAKKS
ncbi:MAG TPA: DUF2497 domain-containing protein [Novosphingobium sp.]|nr:DUF2497 domain-containing protein [Novosphingobium sp.]